MKKVTLGHSDIEVSNIGLGCMGMSEFYGHRNDHRAKETLAKALDLGVNFWDTSDMYGPYHNESLIGHQLSSLQARDKVVIATKFGIMRNDDGTWQGVSGHPDYVRQSCEASLKRLGIETIDLYYQHRIDPNIPIEETVGVMADLKREGKIRAIGLSEVSTKNLKKAHTVHPISAIQSEYSLWTRELELEMLPLCKQLGVSLVAYSPLGRGFLTGKISSRDHLSEGDWRKQHPRFSEENFDLNFQFVEKLKELATNKQCTPAQLALAWVIRQGHIPIPGTTNPLRLEENIAASQISFLDNELDELESILNKTKVWGERYPESVLQYIDQ
ncbi:aldo/keto reductase [Algicola sagamiensis]|uniref:aldo/keto reductase n=1 Tax=Algicola sagamiensis TaxID=163869 RepID=UPI000375F5AA|nr:aldo/keto reductase [Algicola sagamiensis]